MTVERSWFKPVHDCGAFGMCIFFMLSAYLIVTILLREKENTGTIQLRAFAARRVLRIWPLYFLVLFANFFIGRHFLEAHVPGNAVVAFSLLVGNVYIARHGWLPGPIDPLWSLSVEEQFYIVIPALARFGSRRTLLGVCMGTILLSYIVLIWLSLHGAIPIIAIWVNSFVQFQFFAAGGILALALDKKSLSLPLISRFDLACLGMLLWLIAALRFPMHSYTPSHATQMVAGYLLVLAGTAAIFLAAIDIDVHIPAAFTYLGKISYGLYLFHQLWLWALMEPAFRMPATMYIATHRLLATIIALIATIVTAMLSYHYFESPILRFKHRFETVRTRPV